jgi:AcrR family transcriptional regulator
MGCALAMASSAPDGLSPRAREIVAAAREILELDGPEGLSMRTIADRLGIRAPSLYKHVADKGELEVALISDGLVELAEVFEQAVDGSSDPPASLASGYRRWALEHPHLYRLMMDRPLPRERLAPGLEDRAARVVVATTGGDPDAARAAFAFAHGMVTLELNDRFPPGADLDAAWKRGIDAFRPARPRKRPTKKRPHNNTP